ncbi:sensor histidine kinase [[Clostridium] scindens]|uniref:sensor histidine kinase n=1 Tax=Clostridium scindens (strain JCM 10418 / VPI 12708) TaxID=29347 RepID=UPI001D0967F0|nr:sensor histidine kinase [[Clostridium] scindens]MCB6892716.1 sensor histidine kinase [[Clostridium] scindens]
MDTKLKNKHKLAVILIALTIFLPAMAVIQQYPKYYRQTAKVQESIDKSAVCSSSFMEKFIGAGYLLYNTENSEEDGEDTAEEVKEMLGENEPTFLNDFEELYPYLAYRVEDEDGKLVTKSTANSGTSLTDKTLSSYALGIVITYDKNGTIDAKIAKGEYKEDQSIEMRKVIGNMDDSEYDNIFSRLENEHDLERPKNRTYIYAMTEENIDKYMDNEYYSGFYTPGEAVSLIMILMAVVALAAFLYPFLKSFNTGNELVFRAPFEAVAIVFGLMATTLVNNCGYMFIRNEGRVMFIDGLCWIVIFGIVYWTAGCLRQVFVLGGKRYVRERTFLVPSWKYIKRGWYWIVGKVKGWLDRLYHSFDNIDFSEKNNRTILKIVACNFVILVFICPMWFFGIMALIIYSVLLFFILRKYFNDLKEKYALLLQSTNEIAEGNLDVSITDDLGVFNPFKAEIEKIQSGFKKAVDEEVKSQRMKTELITNVSHDLKTPLTAIITYVNLLKEEKDEEKRQDYTQVLERKSLRLKVLIEDLFEISKASSKNVTLDIMDIDVSNLFKQVKLELEDKIQGAGLELRCSYPEEKLIAPLDSQKTYRIFENLLVNIIKYSMPNTRVYIEIVREGQEAVVKMKNISAAELNFDSEEITERFVRGDSARNTEGSGLGLAIVKSFTELQGGKLKISTEADLFKVELRFRLK